MGPWNVCFELWCWRRLLRVPWTARSHQSILKEISPEGLIGRTDAEAETPIPWPPDTKSLLTGKDPDVGKAWGQEEKGAQWTWVWANSGVVKDREACHSAVHGVAVRHDWAAAQQQPTREFISRSLRESENSIAVLAASTRWCSTIMSASDQSPEVYCHWNREFQDEFQIWLSPFLLLGFFKL